MHVISHYSFREANEKALKQIGSNSRSQASNGFHFRKIRLIANRGEGGIGVFKVSYCKNIIRSSLAISQSRQLQNELIMEVNRMTKVEDEKLIFTLLFPVYISRRESSLKVYKTYPSFTQVQSSSSFLPALCYLDFDVLQICSRRSIMIFCKQRCIGKKILAPRRAIHQRTTYHSRNLLFLLHSRLRFHITWNRH